MNNNYKSPLANELKIYPYLTYRLKDQPDLIVLMYLTPYDINLISEYLELKIVVRIWFGVFRVSFC